MTPDRCGTCDELARPGARFCRRCGAVLVVTSTAQPQRQALEPPVVARPEEPHTPTLEAMPRRSTSRFATARAGAATDAARARGVTAVGRGRWPRGWGRAAGDSSRPLERRGWRRHHHPDARERDVGTARRTNLLGKRPATSDAVDDRGRAVDHAATPTHDLAANDRSATRPRYGRRDVPGTGPGRPCRSPRPTPGDRARPPRLDDGAKAHPRWRSDRPGLRGRVRPTLRVDRRRRSTNAARRGDVGSQAGPRR